MPEHALPSDMPAQLSRGIRRLRLDLPWIEDQPAQSAIEEFAIVSDLSVDAVNS